MEVYERIKELRKDTLKMSQAAFGSRLGVNRDVINNIENNRLAKPEQKLSLLKLICKEFSVSEEWLLNGTGDMFASNEAEYSTLIDQIMTGENEFAKNIFKTFAVFEEEDWEALEHMIAMYNSVSAADTDTTATADKGTDTKEDAEAAYIKSRLDTAQSTGLSASSTDAGTEKKVSNEQYVPGVVLAERLVIMAVSEVLTYCGGIPGATKTGDMVVAAFLDRIEVHLGMFKGKYTIPFDSITNVSMKTDEQISKDVTLARMLLIGVFAFGAKKKTKEVKNCVVIEFETDGVQAGAIFMGKCVPKFYSGLLQVQQEYYKRNPDKVKQPASTSPQSADPYAEIEKLHELLEKGIVTQEEFDQKKSQLLGL